jgi:hypothetical protein
MKVSVLVSVADSHLSRMEEVVAACRAAGLEMEHALDQIGTITGVVDPGRIADLLRIPGVAAVERAGGYDIGPPGSDLQ